MQTLIRAITRPNDPPRLGDRLARQAVSFVRGKVVRIRGKRLPTPQAMQALRDKHPPKHAKKA